MNPNGAIIVQSNLEIMVEVDNPNYTTARDAIAPFTELVKSPEHLHTYKISHLSLWNAAATGLRAPEVLERLLGHKSGEFFFRYQVTLQVFRF